jgi:hypothetical protein
MSVSGNTIELTFGGVSVGTFNYAVSGDQMLILSGTDIGAAIKLLAPLEKATDVIVGPGQQMVFYFDLISGGANNNTYRLRMANQWALGDAVIIPGVYEGKPVTEIGSTEDYYNGAFNGANIRAVYIPSSVKSIGGGTFSDCGSLENITFGAGSQLKTIGNSAFSGCESLASVTIPAGVTAVGEYAFYGWDSLQTINVKGYANEADTDAAWGEHWRSGCDADIVYNHEHQWGEWKVTIPATCISEGEETKTCDLDPSHTETRPGTAIDPNAHEWEEVIIPPTCTEEGKESAVCKLCGEQSNTIILSALGHDWLWTMMPLPTETTNGSLTGVCVRGHIDNRIAYATGTAGLEFELINDNTAYRVRKGTVTTGAVHIPAYRSYNNVLNDLPVIEIGSWSDDYDAGAFCNTDISNVTFAEESQLQRIGRLAFSDCDNLTSIDIPAGVTSIGDYSFRKCTNLTSVTIGTGVTSIGNNAFYACTSLTAITIPDSVTYISTSSFENCTSLTNITIPASVTSIGGRAFFDTAWLNSQPDGLVYINRILYVYKGTIPPGTVITNIRTDTVAIADGAFTVGPNSGLTSITIPEGVTSIGMSAFWSCTGLTSVTLPSSLTFIDEAAFRYCENLISITLPAGLTSIGHAAFDQCFSLASIEIPASVTSIGSEAFFYWTASQEIHVRGHASQTSADAAWGTSWRSECNATINYLGQ